MTEIGRAMDPQGIVQLAAAAVSLMVPIGGGITWLVKIQADRREQEKRQRSEYESELEKLHRRNRRLREVAEIWRLQLVRHDIDPIPPGWPEEDA